MVTGKPVFAAAALVAACVFAQERGPVVFTDSFDTPLTFAENWAVGKGWAGRINSADGKVSFPQGGNLQMRRDTPPEFCAEMDITLDMSHEPDKAKWDQAFCGFMIEGYRFMVLPSGKTWMIFKLSGHERAHGKQVPIEGFALKKPVRLTLIRKVENDAATYLYRVNGKAAGSFVCDAPVARPGADGKPLPLKPLEIFSYRVNMTLDNFSLFSLKRSADDSRNVILNSSFEHEQDGFPIYFCRSGFDFAKATTIPYEDFLATWTLDTAEKHSGRQSLKIVFNESTRGQTLWAWGAGTVKDLPGVFSVWLKADREDFPVWLSYGKRQEVKVGTSWQRYEVVNPKLPGAGVYSPVTISFNKMHGTLWVDDLQAEFLGTPDGLAGLEGEGPLATPYRPSELDKQKFTTVKETPVRAPGFAGARLPDGLVPSGNLDTWRAKATRLSTTKTNRVRLKLARDGAALTDQTVPLEERNPVTMLGRLSYYMTEEEAVFKVSTTLAGAEGTTAVLTVAGQTVRAPAAPELRMCVPLEDIPYGTHPAALKLVKGDQTVAATSSQLVKRPYRQGATQVNHFTRSLIHDGKAVFQFAPFFVFAKHQSKEYAIGAVDWADRYGFRYLHILVDNRAVDQALWAIGHAREKGLRVMLWTKYRELTDEEGNALRKRLEFPNVLAQMVMDEPELGTPSEVARAFLREMRLKYPYHPVHMNNTVLGIPNRYADLETDILMLDDYLTNTENRTVASVVRGGDVMWQAGVDDGKPCFYFLVCGNFPLHHREPTYAEQIAQTYGNIAAGCTGFSYFYGTPTTAGNWKAYTQLNREVLALNDILLSEEEVTQGTWSVDPRTLRSITRRHGGHVYVIACNIGTSPLDETVFALPAELDYAREAEVMFEGRRVRVREGKFTDSFPGYSRHVYKVKVR